MWIYVVYCLGAFNACQGNYYTESNPQIGYPIKTIEECKEKGIEQAKYLKIKNPSHNIVWKCMDTSNVEVKEVK